MVAHFPEDQKIKNMEPEKTENWEWFEISALPDQLFLPLKNLLAGEGLDFLEELTG